MSSYDDETTQAVRVVPEIPAFFADGVISQSWGPGISKFYLGRIDSDPNATGEAKTVPVAQVIMPADGFVNLVTFFEHRLKTMIEKGIVTQEAVEKSRRGWAASK